MTDKTTPEGTKTRAAAGRAGSRARATERLPRCGRPKSEDGRPCRRTAGRDTGHLGEGPCSLHDDGSWTRPPFAENLEARAAFLEAVRDAPDATPRSLIEPLGYRKRDVNALIDSDPDFADEYVEARGYDADQVRNEIASRAFDRHDSASAKLLEFLARMRLPEGQALQRHRVDGRLEVTAVDVKLAFQPVFDGAPPGLEEPPAELEP